MNRILSLVLLTVAGLPVLAAPRIDNFTVLDHNGESHALYDHRQAEAIVIMIQGNGCPIVRNAWPTYAELRNRYEARGVAFFMLNANLQDDRASIAEEAALFEMDLPILDDETQLIAESFGVERTAEVFVIDPNGWELAYRGPIDDRLTYERQKKVAGEHYLADTLDALLADQPVPSAQRDAVGCLVNLPGRDKAETHASISYAETIAPMLRDNCAMCHRPGGIGPWAMTGYPMIKGFAPMIREVVRTQRMPPWHADPHVGEFSGDRSLSIEERQQLVHWIEAGAPRGDGPDPLADLAAPASEWPLGEPDLIIDIPPFDVPATGVVDYQFPAVLNPLDRDVWVRAVAVLPGEASVVHHVLAGSQEEAPNTDNLNDVFDNLLATYAPGADPDVYPEGTGVLVPAGGAYLFQMHYTPSGRRVTDRSRLGLYFHDEPPEHVHRHQVILDPTIRIPAGAPAYEEAAYFEFHRPAVIYSLFPHAHYRGRSSKFVLVKPDGTEDTLLSVPRYDFNWQHTYALKEPLTIPAGSRIVHRTVYDNSVRNFANPDPERDVRWGLQSDDEMLYGGINYRWVDETTTAPTHNSRLADLRQFWGFADRDMDGLLVPEEMSRRMREAWNSGSLKLADADGDGRLSLEEYLAAR
ncbi:MAG: redoxin domain-containing protein [Pseudomonadota bacterium]